MSVPTWALSLAYWLHMLATVAWLGALTALAWLVLPAARRSLDDRTYASFLGQIQRRLDPMGWFCLALLAGTGLVQMSANPNYQGFLAFENQWALAILVKHILFLLMIGISAYLTWGIIPRLQRLALRAAAATADGSEGASKELLRREARLIGMNFFLGVLVLALTAIARAS